jgi:hypothetical protein
MLPVRRLVSPSSVGSSESAATDADVGHSPGWTAATTSVSPDGGLLAIPTATGTPTRAAAMADGSTSTSTRIHGS